jgi:hypothetical protein
MKTLSIVAGWLVGFTMVASGATGPQNSEGPSIAETKAWIESEGPAIMTSTEISRAGIIKSSVTALKLDDCVLSWNASNNLTARIPLKDVDTGGLLVDSSTFMGSDPVFSMRITTRASVGRTMTGWEYGRSALVDSLREHVRNREDGERLKKAIIHAAILCGAPASPFGY